MSEQRTTSLRGRHAARLSDQARFWGRVNKGAPNDCWEWFGAGATSPRGYGRFQPELGSRRLVQAHRWAYEQMIGPIPEGMFLDHLCRNRHCVNPAHLEPVTCRENLLRGATFNARNAAKTSCPQGHPYDADNTAHREGRRRCRTCERLRARARRASA